MQLPRRLDASDDGLYRASLLVFVALPPSQRAWDDQYTAPICVVYLAP
jgi:hypothetical protein